MNVKTAAERMENIEFPKFTNRIRIENEQYRNNDLLFVRILYEKY